MDPLRSMFLTGGGSSDRNCSFVADNGLDVFYTFTGKSVKKSKLLNLPRDGLDLDCLI